VLGFNDPPPDRGKPLASVRWPNTPLCEGWGCWRYYYLSDVFRALPERTRLEKAYKTFGPAGAWWLRERVEGRFACRTGTTVREAVPSGSQVRLVLDGVKQVQVTYDHVIAGTGYHLDLARLEYLTPDLRAGIATAGGAPVLKRSFESSVPGLFFVGAMAAGSLGPSMRFLSGTRFTARRVTGAMRSARRSGADQVVSTAA
jgi:hypothetical protein